MIFGLSSWVSSVFSQASRRANDHRASVFLTTWRYGDGAGLVRVAVGTTWVRYQLVRYCSDCTPNTVGLAPRDPAGVEWRDARCGISASAVHSGSLDCAVVCDPVPGQILPAVGRNVVRVK